MALSVIDAGVATPNFGAVSPASRGDIDLTAASRPRRCAPLIQLVEQFNEPTSRRRLLRQCAGRSARTAPTGQTPRPDELLDEHVEAIDRLDAGLQPNGSRTGTMVDPRNLLRAVETAARKAGIKDIGAHTMRHWAAVS